jgi:hypothetical protein
VLKEKLSSKEQVCLGQWNQCCRQRPRYNPMCFAPRYIQTPCHPEIVFALGPMDYLDFSTLACSECFPYTMCSIPCDRFMTNQLGWIVSSAGISDLTDDQCGHGCDVVICSRVKCDLAFAITFRADSVPLGGIAPSGTVQRFNLVNNYCSKQKHCSLKSGKQQSGAVSCWHAS